MAEGSAISRDDVMARAKYWFDKPVPYSQDDWCVDPQSTKYRQDCSGYVSMAWKASPKLTTLTLSDVSTQIQKDQLQKGDIILSVYRDDRHTLIFESWADAGQTHYNAYEQTTPGTKHRVVPYPYFDGPKKHTYKPYRYNHIKP